MVQTTIGYYNAIRKSGSGFVPRNLCSGKVIRCIIQMMRKDTENWIALADYDVETARHMLTTGRYLYVVFLCHLALEKILKAHVTEVTQTFPAKTHDLIYLIKKSGLELPQDILEFIGKINTVSIPTRYHEDLQHTIKEYPQPVAEDYLTQTEKALKWLREQLNKS